MKKLFIIFLLSFTYLFAQSQVDSFPIKTPLGSPKTLVNSEGALRSHLINFTFTDTSQANLLSYLKYYNGTQIMTTTGGLKTWGRLNGAWVLQSGGGSGNDAWSLNLNTMVNPYVSALGTANNFPLYFATNGVKRFALHEDGIQDSSVDVIPIGIDTLTGYLSYARAGGGGGGSGSVDTVTGTFPVVITGLANTSPNVTVDTTTENTGLATKYFSTSYFRNPQIGDTIFSVVSDNHFLFKSFVWDYGMTSTTTDTTVRPKVDTAILFPAIRATITPGGVTGVTASAPLASSGGATPNITADTSTANTGLATLYHAVPNRVIYLSKHGCISDANLKIGSTTTGTDNTATIQAILNTASRTNPLQIMVDGAYGITGLYIKSYTSLIAINNGCGFILKDSSNKAILTNFNKSFNPAARLDSFIVIDGGIYNGNTTGQRNVAATQANGIQAGFQMMGVYNLQIRNIQIRTTKSYAIAAWNIKQYYVSNFSIICGAGVNTDGIHADGNCEDFYFSNGYIQGTNDDAIAINADDNFATAYPFYAGMNGPVRNGIIENIYIDSGFYGIRILSDSSIVDKITFRNIKGVTTYKWLETDRAGLPGPGYLGDILFDDIHIDTKHPSTVFRYGAQISTGFRNLTFNNLVRNNFDLDSCYTIKITSAVNGGTLNINNYQSLDTNGVFTDHIYMDNGVINTISIGNTKIKTDTTRNGSLIHINGGRVNRLILNGVEVDNYNNIVNNTLGTLDNISASNITHTGNTDSAGTFNISSGRTVQDIVLSNYYGFFPTSGTGTVYGYRGDGFLQLPSRPIDPADVYDSITFIHFVNGPLNNAAGVWTSSITDAAYNHKGEIDEPLSAGINGGLQMYADAAADGCKLGWNADGPWPITPYIYIGFEFVAGNVWAYDGILSPSNQGAISVGYYYRVIRTGGSFVLKKCATENGTYTTVYTYSTTYSSDLIPMCDIAGDATLYKLFYPKASGL